MALLQGIKKLFGPLLDEWTASVPLKRTWSSRRRKEENEVAAASSSDKSIEENPEDDWSGTITQAPSARARTS
jgi:hypothetical protein